MPERHCICKPYHVLWCPAYGEDNRNVKHADDCPCVDCTVTALHEARGELLAEALNERAFEGK